MNRSIVLVSDITGIKSNDILSKCRRQDLVDARCLLAYALWQQGLYTIEIAALMSCTGKHVRHQVYAIRDKIKSSMRFKTMVERLRTKLEPI